MTGFTRTQFGNVAAKTAAEMLDYGFDWSAWLATSVEAPATINTSTWATDEGITVTDTGLVNTSQTVCRLTGGTVGKKYWVTNTVTLSDGRRAVRSFQIQVVDRQID